ncbi:MAG: hypothetical protein JWO51_108 [Rhodospirillales bacterium]|nr:hypothetical protein [Rhodospirillales bacterium]
MTIETRLRDWLKRREHERLLRRFGGTQTCPWCRQCAQEGDGPWSLATWERDQFLDVLTCGVCGGTSLWRFEMLMLYVAPLCAPVPDFQPDIPGYDVKSARPRFRSPNTASL